MKLRVLHALPLHAEIPEHDYEAERKAARQWMEDTGVHQILPEPEPEPALLRE